MNRVGLFGLTAALAASLLSAGTAPAQGRPADPRQTQRFWTKSANFRMPVGSEDRTGVAEILCHVRKPGGEWTLHQSAPAGQTAFPYTATEDGEYSFQFTVIDKQGRPNPPTPDTVPPRIIVVVDTAIPEVEVHPLRVLSGRVFLQCTVRDANPDYSTVRLETRVGDGWQPLEALPDTPGVFDVPDEAMLRSPVRVTAADRAGNRVTREVEPGTAPMVAVAPPPKPAPEAVKPAGAVADTVALPVGPRIVAEKPAFVTPPTEKPAELPVAVDKPALVGGTRCVMQYALDAAGPAAVGRVDVWATKDGGKSWRQVGTDGDRSSPAEFDLTDGDGVYGVAIMVGRIGSGPQSPAAGDSPDCWLEIDATKPAVKVTRAEKATEPGIIVVAWEASDANVAAKPVSLAWSAGPDGPWQPLASDLPATGEYRWTVPAGLTGSVVVRAEAADRAGNVGRADGPSLTLEPPPRQRVRVIGVAGAKP